MKNTLATHANVCGNCSAVFHPRRDNPTATYCTKACHLAFGIRYEHDDSITYGQWHKRLYKKYGKASQHACSTLCCRPARHWACVGDYENLEEYVPMCVSCHKRFDMARIRASKVAA